jgi:hypothetical protein
MKLGVLAASTLIAVASLGSASFAQSGGSDGSVMSRSSRTTSATDSAGRVPVVTQAPTLEGARPAAGMLPMQQTCPVRDVTVTASNRPGEGGDMRSSLR